METLCGQYWLPVYSFVRSRNFDAPTAEDITQDFFSHLVQQSTLLKRADPANGRFRTYLLAAVKNHIANHRRGQNAIKRGGGFTTFSIDVDAERRYLAEPTDNWTAEAIFNRQWAIALLDHVLNRLAQRYEDRDRTNWFETIRPFLTINARPSYDQLAEQLGTTPAAARVAVHRIRKEYRDALACEIAATIGEGESVSDERTELLRALNGG